MTPPPTHASQTPSVKQVLSQDAQSLTQWAGNTFGRLLDRIFGINRTGAMLRLTSFLAIAFFLWSWWAFRATDIQWDQPINPLLTSIVKAYAAPRVLRRIMVVALAYWVTFRGAATYLDDIFELQDAGVAARFISQAAFASSYNTITIRDAGIAPQDANSPIYRIGGPGMVRVNLENAALFERYDGSPHVIGPSQGRGLLEGFERLREVFDLRDQVENLEVVGRTKDGIPVTAKDIRVVFSVYRGQPAAAQDRPKELQQPYPFTEKALENLVYNQSNRPWTITAKNAIQSQIRRFISDHTLSEFLAQVTTQEMTALQKTQEQTPGEGLFPGYARSLA